MNMQRTLKFAGVAIALGLASTAHATIVTGTFTGVVTYSSLTNNQAGLANGAITYGAGAPTISGTFSYDSSILTTVPFGPGFYAATQYYPSIPLTITNNFSTGQSITVTANSLMQVYANQGQGYTDFNLVSSQAFGAGPYEVMHYGDHGPTSSTVLDDITDVGTAHFSGIAGPSPWSYAEIDLPSLAPDGISFSGNSFDQINFEITFMDAGPEEPAPEPASLALLGAGLAGLSALRRRKRT